MLSLLAYFALLNPDNTVQTVIVADQEEIAKRPGTWVEASKPDHGNAGKHANIGDTYDPVDKKFYRPKPFPSWKLNKQRAEWEPPTPEPKTGDDHLWDEKSKSWKRHKP